VKVFQPRHSKEKNSTNTPEPAGQNGQKGGEGGFVHFVQGDGAVSEKNHTLQFIAVRTEPPIKNSVNSPHPLGQNGQNLPGELSPGSLERLPWQLENLIRAASSDALPTSAKLETGIVPDLNRYVMAGACGVLTGNREEALSRLWAVWQVWRGHLERKLN
jgi:hypothetical protein